MEREQHNVEITLANVQIGQDNIYTFTICGQQIHLGFDGQYFYIYRTEDVYSDTFGTVSIVLQ